MSIEMFVSKVTRHSENVIVLREACRIAAREGRAFSITESFTSGDWWTEFKIERPITQVTYSIDEISLPAFDMDPKE